MKATNFLLICRRGFSKVFAHRRCCVFDIYKIKKGAPKLTLKVAQLQLGGRRAFYNKPLMPLVCFSWASFNQYWNEFCVLYFGEGPLNDQTPISKREHWS